MFTVLCRHARSDCKLLEHFYVIGRFNIMLINIDIKIDSLFSTTHKVNDPCGQHIYIQEQCSTFDKDK